MENDLLFARKGGNTFRVGLCIFMGVFAIAVAIYIYSSIVSIVKDDPFVSHTIKLFFYLSLILLVAVGVFSFKKAAEYSQCWLKIYTDHIEGQPVGLTKQPIVIIPYHQVTGINLFNDFVVLTVDGKTVRFMMHDSADAFEAVKIINNCIHNNYSNQDRLN